MKKSLFLFVSLIQCSLAQEIARDTTFLTLQRKDVATYGTIAWSAGAVFMEFQWWWKDDYYFKQHEFRIKNDGYFYNSSYGIDKLGHMYSSYLIFGLTYDFLRWANYDEETAIWSAIAVPASHALAIELGDGFSKWAFNVNDLYFNSAGILYGVLQIKYPFLKNFNYKWSYYPTGLRPRNDPDWGPASDYGGHIYWLAVDVHNILPESLQKFWTPYLNVSFGLGVKNMYSPDHLPKQHKFAIGLDWNTNAILPDGDTWNIFKNLINKIHLPAPGIKFHTTDRSESKLFLLN